MPSTNRVTEAAVASAPISSARNSRGRLTSQRLRCLYQPQKILPVGLESTASGCLNTTVIWYYSSRTSHFQRR
jgi:hypothetical protein